MIDSRIDGQQLYIQMAENGVVIDHYPTPEVRVSDGSRKYVAATPQQLFRILYNLNFVWSIPLLPQDWRILPVRTKIDASFQEAGELELICIYSDPENNPRQAGIVRDHDDLADQIRYLYCGVVFDSDPRLKW